jgi:hypothetical protein
MGKITEENLSATLRTLADRIVELTKQIHEVKSVVAEFHTKEDSFNMDYEASRMNRFAAELEFLAFKHDKKFE